MFEPVDLTSEMIVFSQLSLQLINSSKLL